MCRHQKSEQEIYDAGSKAGRSPGLQQEAEQACANNSQHQRWPENVAFCAGFRAAADPRDQRIRELERTVERLRKRLRKPTLTGKPTVRYTSRLGQGLLTADCLLCGWRGEYWSRTKYAAIYAEVDAHMANHV
jgi:hypothetical protein